MTDDSSRRPQPHEPARHHEIDIERAAHPGEPRRVSAGTHETRAPEPMPRFGGARGGVRERAG